MIRPVTAETINKGKQMKVAGKQIQIDRSGQGHAWQNIDSDDIPSAIREEIEGEIIDGKKAECDHFVASNGQHYRWGRVS